MFYEKEIEKQRWPLVDAIMDEVYNYREQFQGEYPVAILVGPNEWFSLYMDLKNTIYHFDHRAQKASFAGIDLLPMTRPGVALVPDIGVVPFLAEGKVRDGTD